MQENWEKKTYLDIRRTHTHTHACKCEIENNMIESKQKHSVCTALVREIIPQKIALPFQHTRNRHMDGWKIPVCQRTVEWGDMDVILFPLHTERATFDCVYKQWKTFLCRKKWCKRKIGKWNQGKCRSTRWIAMHILPRKSNQSHTFDHNSIYLYIFLDKLRYFM